MVGGATGSTERLTYEGTIKALLHTQRGAYDKLEYLPVFRASGVFYAVVDDERSTIVSFMNYWKIKNHIETVGALVTLRDRDGERIARSFFNLDHTVYQIDARELIELSEHQDGNVQEASLPFEGTMELEFFSSEDLKFAFPALLVYYTGPKGASCVHTNQRTFNNQEDLRRGSRFNSWQTGFDIHCRDGASPFVFLVNGEKTAPAAKADLAIFNEAGDRMDTTVDLGDLPPYGARKLDIGAVDGVRGFLGDGTGFVKADVGLNEVYCRFACGVEHPDGFLAVTHSYFDCNGFEDYYGKDAFSDDVYPCFVPVNLLESVDVDVVFYPIQSPANLRFAVQAFNTDGSQKAWVDIEKPFRTDAGDQIRIDPKKLLSEAGVETGEEMVCVHIASETGEIPSRITFGLNYHVGELPGSNISSSVLMASSHGAKSRSWLWGAAIHQTGGKNWAMVSHMSRDKADRSTPTYTVSVYNREGQVATDSGVLANGTGVNIDIDAMLAEQGYSAQNGEFFWYVVHSDNPSLICNQIHVSADGRIGGDHSF